MRHAGLGLSILAAAASASVVVGTESEAAGRNVRKHHQRMSPYWGNTYRDGNYRDSAWASGQLRPVARPPAGDVCPGSGRSFDCKIWPPPFDQDPDRKISGSDGGG